MWNAKNKVLSALVAVAFMFNLVTPAMAADNYEKNTLTVRVDGYATRLWTIYRPLPPWRQPVFRQRKLPRPRNLPDDPNEAAKALSYIRSQPNITAEEVEYHA